MPSYEWSCLACGAVNAPASEHCENCGCSARPTYAGIQSAKKAAGVVEPIDGPTLTELAAGFKAYLTGKPGDRGLMAAALLELVSYAVVLLLLLFIFEICKSLGFL